MLTKLKNNHSIQLLMALLVLGVLGSAIQILPNTNAIGELINNKGTMRMTINNGMPLEDIRQRVQRFQPDHRVISNHLEELGIIIINGHAQTPNEQPISIIVHRTREGKIKLTKQSNI